MAQDQAQVKNNGKGKAVVSKPEKKGKQQAESEDESEDEDEDEETRRLRKRMEAAMAQASDEESDLDDDDNDEEQDDNSDISSGSEEELGDQQSFHTDSDAVHFSDEGGLEGYQDDGDESDDSEKLEDLPMDSKSKTMWAQMQAMMEATEKRAGVTSDGVDSGKTEKRAKTQEEKSEERKRKAKEQSENEDKEKSDEEEENDDEAQWDLAPGVKPLPKSVLQAAVKAEEEKKAREAEKKASQKVEQGAEQSRRKKRKIAKVETSRKVSDKTTLHLLPQTLSSAGPAALPPIIDARSRPGGTAPAGKATVNKFYKRAMKNSGVVPGRSPLDGRRRAVSHALR